MAYEQKPGQGSLFKNDKKTEDKHPDYKGSLMTPDGVECWVSAWVKRPEGRDPFMSMSIQVKETTPTAAGHTPTPATPEPADGLPF